VINKDIPKSLRRLPPNTRALFAQVIDTPDNTKIKVPNKGKPVVNMFGIPSGGQILPI
jgi:hypothetical protein